MSRFGLGRPSPALVVSTVAPCRGAGRDQLRRVHPAQEQRGNQAVEERRGDQPRSSATAPWAPGKISNGTVTAKKINPTGLTVPNALHANSATNANHASSADSATNAITPAAPTRPPAPATV
jgi:hypothetical protein